jgi:hypothetical protein
MLLLWSKTHGEVKGLVAWAGKPLLPTGTFRIRLRP